MIMHFLVCIWGLKYICVVYTFLFTLGNERTLVTCKSWEARSSKFYTRPVSFHFPMQTKKVYFNPYIYVKAMKNPWKVEKFPSSDQCLSFENICHSFLMLHCRRMSWECKYLKIIVNSKSCEALLKDMHVNSFLLYPYRKNVLQSWP